MPQMQIRRMLLASVLLCTVFATSGCAPEAPKASPSPTKTAVFASEEDALQAAIDVYQKFNAAYDAVLSDPGVGYDSLTAFASQPLVDELEASESTEGLRMEGSTSFDRASVVKYSDSKKTASVRIKLCRDVSGTKFYNSAGDDVTPSSRSERFPYEVLLEWNKKRESLQVNDMGSWQGDDFCDSMP